jgi:hypothetical protein
MQSDNDKNAFVTMNALCIIKKSFIDGDETKLKQWS